MKRKHGQKKGNVKKPRVITTKEEASSAAGSLNLEDKSGLNDAALSRFDPTVVSESASPELSDHTDKYASINSDGLVDKTTEKITYGPVKVKLKASNALELQPGSLAAPSQNNTDKCSFQVSLEKRVVAEKMDSLNSLNDLEVAASGVSSMKSGSIRIKSPKKFNSSTINHASNEKSAQSEATCPDETSQAPNYNKAELDAALVVIKKVMKMDAAEPFNVPVNPIGLGIPDYFDVIDTPMDFGTICRNLEKDSQYMNSEDVYKDVQYIWGNCYKYNNKGDYILELMKRVKKNFTKYWAAAKLYSGQSSRAGVVQSVPEESTAHVLGKLFNKGAQSKTKAKKKHGFKRHKEHCACAICIMKRRRMEREQNDEIAEEPTPTTSGDAKKQPGSRGNEDVSSNMEKSDTDGELDEVEEDKHKEMVIADNGAHKQVEIMLHKEEEDTEVKEHEKGSSNRVGGEQWIDCYEKSRIVEICGTLFTQNPNSGWCAPHSLIEHRPRTSISNSNSIEAAIASFSC